MERLGPREVNTVLAYIGCQGGKLGDFTYSTLNQFYPDICDVDIDSNKYNGTMKERFIEILSEVEPLEQSKILEGVINKYTLNFFEFELDEGKLTQAQFDNKKRIHKKIEFWISELQGLELLNAEDLVHNYEIVKESLDQCQTLISEHKYKSAVDRAHTALHGYLQETCKKAGLELNINKNPKIQDYWGKLKKEHPSLKFDCSQSHLPVNQIIKSIGSLLQELNDIRNKNSYAHPNDKILGENEAELAVNLMKSILRYIDSKIQE